MSSSAELRLTAYHGTSAKNSSCIQKHGYKISKSEDNWLGPGVYFFETHKPITDGKVEAEAWGKNIKRFNACAIFEAVIESQSYIDLVESIDHRKMYDKIKKVAIEKHKQVHGDYKDFKEQVIFCVMDKEISNVDFFRVLVDGSFTKKYPSYLVRRAQIQICVKNLKCIIENTCLE